MADQESDVNTENDEIELLSFIQEAYQSSHDWDVVLEQVKQEYNISYLGGLINFCAIRGYVNAIQWLRRPDLPGGPCSWNEWACYNAAWNGHVGVLKYLYEEEAPFLVPNTRYCKVHENCKEFMDTYGESWNSRRFDVPLYCMKPAKA